MFSAHWRAGKPSPFSKRASQSSGSSAPTTRKAASSSRTTSLPSAWCHFSPTRLQPDLDLATLYDHLMGAEGDLREGVELTPDVEHPDLAPPDLHHPAGPLLDMLQGEPPGYITVRGQGPDVSLTWTSQSTTRISLSLSLRSFWFVAESASTLSTLALALSASSSRRRCRWSGP